MFIIELHDLKKYFLVLIMNCCLKIITSVKHKVLLVQDDYIDEAVA